MPVIAELRGRFLSFFLICSVFLISSLNLASAQDALATSISDVSQLRFSHISTDEGLSQTTVQVIAQDSLGFMWFGTQFGLNRFDGYSMTVYHYDPTDITSLIGDNIVDIHEDSSGYLWIRSFNVGGISRYSYETDNFTRFVPGTDTASNLPGNVTTNPVEDSRGRIWIGTDAGLAEFDQLSERFTWYTHQPGDADSLIDNHILSIKLDHQDNLWIATVNGISRLDSTRSGFQSYQSVFTDFTTPIHTGWVFDLDLFLVTADGAIWIGTNHGVERLEPSTNHVDHFVYDPAQADGLASTDVFYLFEDNAHRLWIAGRNTASVYDAATKTFQHFPVGHSEQTIDVSATIFQDTRGTIWLAGGQMSGLHRFNEQSQQFEEIEDVPTNRFSLGDNKVTTLFEDLSGILWIGTVRVGAASLNLTEPGFALYQHLPGNPNSISTSYVYSIYEDRSGSLWIGGDDGVLNRFDRAQNTITHYEPDGENSQGLSPSFSISALFEDSQNAFWVGTFDGGLHIMNRETGMFEQFHPDGQPGSLASNIILSLFEDSHQNLWVGTGYPSALQRFDRSTRTFVNVDLPADSIVFTGEGIRVIYEDHDGILWLGGWSDGLYRFNPQTGEFNVYRHEDDDPSSLSDDSVYAIGEDNNGDLWFGTRNGLNRLNRDINTFTIYTTQDGLPDGTVYGLLFDDENKAWLSTNKGLARFDPASGAVTSYTELQNIQGIEFNQSAYFKSASGEMFFGGTNGVNAFYPQNVHTNPYIPPVMITGFTVFNQPIEIQRGGILSQSILTTDQITLNYTDSVFSFEFASLAYLNPDQNRYRYRLMGFDEQWNEVDSRHRFATYTNIPGGHYTFQVQGSNETGVWDEVGTSIALTIVPAWWDTSQFHILLTISVLAASVISVRLYTRSMRMRAIYLQHVVDERTQDLRISAKISHQITTVLEQSALLNQLATLTQQSFKLTQVSVYLVSDEKTSLRLVAKSQAKSPVAFNDMEVVVPISGTNPIARAANTLKALVDTDDDPKPLTTTGSEIAVPIIFNQELLGVLDLQSQTKDRFKSQKDIDLFTSFSNQIAIALRNSRLFADLEKAKDRAEESDRVKSAFLASMSHELRTPLNAIINFSKFLIRGVGGTLSAQQSEMVSTIAESGDHLLSLINDVLDMSKIEAGSLILFIEEDIAVLDIIHTALEYTRPLLSDKPVTMQTDIPETLPMMDGDQKRLLQIMLNILSNACKFTAEGHVLVHACAEGTKLSIMVEDTGIGISPEDFTHVFQPFKQTTSGLRTGGGTGLGMPICKKLVEAMGGKIWFESTLNKGTTFYVELPLKPQTKE